MANRDPFFVVHQRPDKGPPPVRPDFHKYAPSGQRHIDYSAVVSMKPWRRTSFKIGDVSIRGRRSWNAKDPIWRYAMIYYNTAAIPLPRVLTSIVLHHTNNRDSIEEVEISQQQRSRYAALGYHFFIDKDGVAFEGRPLEVMGSHAGRGLRPGPKFDPDWGAVGIALQGDYHRGYLVWSDLRIPKRQLEMLRALVVALRRRYSLLNKLLTHREAKVDGYTACPGDLMIEKVEALRSELRMTGP